MQWKISFVIYLLVLVTVIIAAFAVGPASGSSHTSATATAGKTCKELKNISCYQGKHEGYFCSRKDQTATEVRWYYDKGVCKKFMYKGCNGNRNRFCTREICEHRCAGE